MHPLTSSKNWPVAPAVLQRLEIILEKTCACFAHLISEQTAASDVLSSFLPPFIFFCAFSFLSGYLMVHCRRMCILGVTRTRRTQVMHMQLGCQNEKLKKDQAQCTRPPLQRRGCTDFLCW